jgi:hypothetical protein
MNLKILCSYVSSTGDIALRQIACPWSLILCGQTQLIVTTAFGLYSQIEFWCRRAAPKPSSKYLYKRDVDNEVTPRRR